MMGGMPSLTPDGGTDGTGTDAGTDGDDGDQGGNAVAGGVFEESLIEGSSEFAFADNSISVLVSDLAWRGRGRGQVGAKYSLVQQAGCGSAFNGMRLSLIVTLSVSMRLTLSPSPP